jgi:succinate-acetate transporter protein
LVAGGIAQFLAGMWSYKARDGVATAMHGIWGSFWMAYGVLYLLIATHVLPATPLGVPNVALAMWFVALCAVTATGALASLGESLGIFSVLSTLAVGSGFFAAGLWGGWVTSDRIAGWLFVVSAACAWYTASAMMLTGATGRSCRSGSGPRLPTCRPGDRCSRSSGRWASRVCAQDSEHQPSRRRAVTGPRGVAASLRL